MWLTLCAALYVYTRKTNYNYAYGHTRIRNDTVHARSTYTCADVGITFMFSVQEVRS